MIPRSEIVIAIYKCEQRMLGIMGSDMLNERISEQEYADLACARVHFFDWLAQADAAILADFMERQTAYEHQQRTAVRMRPRSEMDVRMAPDGQQTEMPGVRIPGTRPRSRRVSHRRQ